MWLRQIAALILISASLQATAAEVVDVCDIGMMQSPININSDKVVEMEMPDLIFRYKFSQMRSFYNRPINYQALPDPNDALMLEIDTVRYPLENIHLHNPSPHQLKGRTFPLEIHFVHRSIEGNQVVVAQWARIGKHNPALETMLNNFALGLTFGLDPSKLLAPFRSYYQYEGSQISAPCTENATWYVIKNQIEVGTDQVGALNRLVGKNTRPTQPLNARDVFSKK